MRNPGVDKTWAKTLSLPSWDWDTAGAIETASVQRDECSRSTVTHGSKEYRAIGCVGKKQSFIEVNSKGLKILGFAR